MPRDLTDHEYDTLALEAFHSAASELITLHGGDAPMSDLLIVLAGAVAHAVEFFSRQNGAPGPEAIRADFEAALDELLRPEAVH